MSIPYSRDLFKTHPFVEMMVLINLRKVLVHEALASSLTEQI